jgi:hypothetical protein
MRNLIIILLFIIGTHAQSQTFKIQVDTIDYQITVVNNYKESWYLGYRYIIRKDCDAYFTPWYNADDTITFDIPETYFEGAFSVEKVVSSPWGQQYSPGCLRFWHPIEIVNKIDTIFSNTTIEIENGMYVFEWFNTNVIGNKVTFQFNGMQIPGAILTERYVLNSGGVFANTQSLDSYTLPPGIYYALSVVKAQGATFLSSNNFYIQ